MPSKTAWFFAAAMGVPSLALVIYIHQRSEPPSAENAQVFAKKDVDPALRPKLNEPPPNSLLLSTAATPAPSASSLNFVRSDSEIPPPPAATPPAPSAPESKPILSKTVPKEPAAAQPSSTKNSSTPSERPKLQSMKSNFDVTQSFKKVTFHTRDTTLFKPDSSLSNSLLKASRDKKNQLPSVVISTFAATTASRPAPANPPQPISDKKEAAAPPQTPENGPPLGPTNPGRVVNLNAVQSAPPTLQRTPKGGVPLDSENSTSE